MSDQLLLFKQEGQHVYDYTNVYDPDVDGSNVANSGKIVPSVRSIVIDNRTSSNKVYLVKAVNATTYKVTYMDFPYKVVDTNSVILNYGNDVFMLYYDNRTSPTRLTVDAKMILFGSNIAKYRLMKDGVQINYNLVQESGDTQYAVSDSEVAEVTDQYVNGIRRCNTCYTTSVLTDGDLVTLELYDATGVLVGEVELIARASTILNSLSAAVNAITGFGAECNQMDGEDWYLYKGQAKSNLSVYPTITFANSTSFVVPVDGNACFIYGMEDVDTTKIGNRYPILIKYYIDNRYQVDPSLDVVAGNKRVLCSSHILKIIDKPIGTISKMSVLPVWNASAQGYNLYFFAYTANRAEPTVVTSRILTNDNTNGANFGSTNTFIDSDGVSKSTLISGSFNPKLFGSTQTFTVKFVAAETGSLRTYHEQTFKIILKNPTTIPATGNGRDLWNIIDPNNANVVYGVDDSTYNRPELKYDATAGKHFFDSTNQFHNVTEFIETFYRLASPPALNTETQAPNPTQFRIKDVLGNVLVASMNIARYHVGINVLTANTETPVSSGVVVVEFLYNNSVVYGVPVLVTQADGTYVPSTID